MLPPPGRVTYPITTFKLSCSRFWRGKCIHSAVDQFAGKGNRMMEISKTAPNDSQSGRGTFLKEVRCAVRFPLSLPVELSDEKHHSEEPAVTRNVSANGVLLELSGPLDVGEELDFHLRMPGSVLGTPQDVLVHCRGRVVRCSISQSHYQAAATIDEYHFVEQ
jgi:hypothetical protein